MKLQRVENLLGALALSVTDAMAHGIEQVKGTYGSDAFALVLIQHAERLRSDVLARQLKLAQSSTVRLIDRLQADGLVRRTTGTDRRTVIVSLTARGKRVAADILAARQSVLRDLVATLDESERTALHSISTRLLTHLTVDLVSGEQNCRLCDEEACDLVTCPVETRYQTFEGALQPPPAKLRARSPPAIS